MKIKGIGTDILSIARMKKSIEKGKDKFLDRLFTKRERDYCLKYKKSEAHFAGRFAAKEAIAKTFGVGFQNGLSFLDIEIINNELGKPEVFLSEKLKKNLKISKKNSILITISHCKEYASAFAIFCE